ncbi:Rrf2 family transcriptional regulator [Ammoniphilus sp. CFH 90114]|uniref:RrF2 family transcriptional regulator n=1 Tax=Ammoniphilus sp. CFH 90114 TaxID=2493665 RepID=UPI00100E89E2|nr:Rrf2 family transcriptional regulator [Ammoniphilus sp. CFH 90114]RXT07043.1 Rrf2 family transcriptional regulator [Ammoniphilus sp. CFH 90114]
MHLTSYTDYSLRLLIYLGAQTPGVLSSVKEISTVYDLSYNHLGKITFKLGKLGLIETVRGRNGGIRLAKAPKEINLGWVVRQTEDDLQVVECFGKTNTCRISSVCRLKGILGEALEAYFRVLDSYTLEDVLSNKDAIQLSLGLSK